MINGPHLEISFGKGGIFSGSSKLSEQEKNMILPDQVRLMYRNALPLIIGNIGVACLFFWMMKIVTDSSLVYAWFAGALMVLGVRFYHYISFTKENQSSHYIKNPKGWLRKYITFATFQGLFWGLAVMAPLYFEGPTGRAYVSMVLFMLMLFGLSFLACVTAGAHVMSTWGVLTASMLPVTIYLISQDIIGLQLIGYCLFVAVPLVGFAAFLVQTVYVRALLLRIRNQKLVEEVVDNSRRSRRSIDGFKTVVDHLSAAYALYDENLKLLAWNKAYEKIFNFPHGFVKEQMKMTEAIGWFHMYSGKSPDHLDGQIAERMEMIEQARENLNAPVNRDISMPDGGQFSLSINALPDGNVLTVFSDVTHREKRYAERIMDLTQRDSLTNLANRVMVKKHLRKELLTARAEKRLISIIHIGIDYFKDVNDTYGHQVGDQLIKAIADQLSSLLNKEHFLSRYGGDEFAIIGKGYKKRKEIYKLVSLIDESFKSPIDINGKSISVNLSVGVTIFPDDEGTAEQLFRNADIALHNAKQRGRGATVYYDPGMHKEIMNRTTLQTDIRDSMATSQFVMHYQPQVDIKTRQICGVEALMRWKHPERGWVSPDEFIPIAEFSQQIIPLTEQLLPEACMQAALWQAQGFMPIRMSVNISPLHFHDRGLVEFVSDCLKEAQLSPDVLELEITERVVMSGSDDVAKTLNALSELGVHMSVDDFGTGFSSISYLRSLPVDKLKIDQAFVSDLKKKKGASSVIKAIVELGHSFDLEVIAEGVETMDQLKILEEIKCDQAQGYYFSKPRTGVEITEWFREHS